MDKSHPTERRLLTHEAALLRITGTVRRGLVIALSSDDLEQERDLLVGLCRDLGALEAAFVGSRGE